MKHNKTDQEYAEYFQLRTSQFNCSPKRPFISLKNILNWKSFQPSKSNMPSSAIDCLTLVFLTAKLSLGRKCLIPPVEIDLVISHPASVHSLFISVVSPPGTQYLTLGFFIHGPWSRGSTVRLCSRVKVKLLDPHCQ